MAAKVGGVALERAQRVVELLPIDPLQPIVRRPMHLVEIDGRLDLD